MVLALTLVSGAALISVLTLQRGLTQWKNQAASSSQKLAFYYAEAGIAEAMDALRSGGSGNVGTMEMPAMYGDGAFWVEALMDENGCYHLTSTGLHGPTAYRLSQTVHKPQLPIAKFGFFGQYDVDLGDGVTVAMLGQPGGSGPPAPPPDDPPPAEPPPAEPPAAPAGARGAGRGKRPIALPTPVVAGDEPQPLVGSNGRIGLGLGAHVHGPCVPGPGDAVENLFGSPIDGTTVPAEEMRTLPEIAMPMSDTTATLTLAPSQQYTLPSGTHAFEAITLSSRGTLTVEGPSSLFVNDLRVPSLGTLAFDTTNGAVHVYVGDFLWVAPASRVTNSSGDASDLIFLVDGRGTRDRDGDDPEDVEGPVLWETARPMVGGLYAPYAMVVLPPGSNWTGSIAAMELCVGDGSTLTFDPRVLDVDLVAKRFHFLSWRVMEIPPEDRRMIVKDLVRQAIARGDTPPAAAAARIDATNEFRIRTDEGAVMTYMGEKLSDMTQESVDAVLPAKVEVEEVPAFSEYEKEYQDADDATTVAFKRAYNAMLESITKSGGAAERWAAALETGKLPADVVQSIGTDGVLVEPFLSALSSPALREAMAATIVSAPLPAASRRLIYNAINLFP